MIKWCRRQNSEKSGIMQRSGSYQYCCKSACSKKKEKKKTGEEVFCDFILFITQGQTDSPQSHSKDLWETIPDFQNQAIHDQEIAERTSAVSLIHTLSNELMNYEFSRGNNGFVCWGSSWNDSHYKWKKRLAQLQSAIMEMPGHFFCLWCQTFKLQYVKCNPFTMWKYCNHNHNKIVMKLNSATIHHDWFSRRQLSSQPEEKCNVEHSLKGPCHRSPYCEIRLDPLQVLFRCWMRSA